MKLLLVLILGTLPVFHVQNTGLEKAQAVLDKMYRAIELNHSIRVDFTKHERWEGEMVTASMKYKVSYNPHRIYMHNLEPNEGVEILYRDGENNNEALVNPNGFPFVNMDMDPFGKVLRKPGAGHHTMLDLGFQFIGNLIRTYLKPKQQIIEQCLFYKGTTMFDGKPCYVIEMKDPNFKFYDYTVKANEDVLKIAKERGISEDMIVQANEKVDWFDDVEEGQTIKIATSYAKRVVLHIDQSTYMPIEQFVYDHEGLYEHFEFRNCKINTVIPDAEFQKDFEEYDF